MSQELLILSVTAASIGLLHTLLGPDHYLPFVAMARARQWSTPRTAWVTVLCGLGHVLSSVVLGGVGIAAGIGLTKLEGVESFRGELAGWALVAFGLVYFVWGLRKAIRGRPHEHGHAHSESGEHEHTHQHDTDHLHVHGKRGKADITPWVLFAVFVFGPCEPLIPLLMYPAARSSLWGVALVALVFGVVTIATMLGVVMACSLGVKLVPLGKAERYAHAMAGGAICLSGVAITLIGL